MNSIRSLLFTVAITFLAVQNLAAQDSVEDRRRYIDGNTVVSDDPRRIPKAPTEHPSTSAIALVGGKVFDGTGTNARLATIVIQGNHIKSVLATNVEEWPSDTHVIDVSGKTILPGLIDMHAHITDPEEYTNAAGQSFAEIDIAELTLLAVERSRIFIESGVTSIRDLSSHGAIPFRLKAWSEQNRIPAPRIFAAGQLITGLGGHGAEGFSTTGPNHRIRIASGPDDWRQAVREQFNRGADLIKLASHYSKAEVSAAIDEAHALGLKVTVDAETFYIKRAVEAGADMIEHPLPRSDATIRLMAKKGTAADPTIVPYVYIFDRVGGYFGSSSRRFTLTKDSLYDMTRKLREAGIKLGIGLDMWGFVTKEMPQPYIDELKNFVAVGFTVSEALSAATKVNAELLDMGDKLGTIEVGKLADLIVVDGNPAENIDDLNHIDLVIKNGNIVVRQGRAIVQPPPKVSQAF